jgi:diguanylate cyclase (GGDEF)-like protein
MPEGERERLEAVLAELCTAVGADGGCTLYLTDSDGVLNAAASVGAAQARGPSLLQRLRRATRPREAEARTLVLNVPGATPGIVVLARHDGADFTRQDSGLARLYLRRLAEGVTDISGRAAASGWTRQLETIQRIAARLTRLASVEEVATTICTETRQVINYDEAQVLIADEADGALRVVAAANASEAHGHVLPLPSIGAAAEAILRASSGVPVLASDLPSLGSGRAGPCSLLVVPLHFETRVTGVICLIACGPRHFDDDDLRLLQILSDQAAVAIENARLLTGRDQLVHELAALLELSEAAGAASDEVDLARLLADKIRAATRTDAAIVSRWDEDSIQLRELWRDGLDGPQPAVDLADSPVRRSVLRDGRPQIVHADSADQIPEVAYLRMLGGRTLMCLPLNAGGRTIGVAELISFGETRLLDPSEMKTAEAMATLGATGLEKVRLLEQLRNAADMDLVTGVHNHRYLQERLRQEVARSARSHSPFALLMLDLDHFKPINDLHGHADGDRVLHNIGAAIRANVRTSDMVARYGGDEFVVLMPDTSLEYASQVARRVVAGIVERRHTMSDGSEVGVGVSAGLAVYPADGRTSAALLQAADNAMYSAKRSGGQQVERPAPVAIHVEAVPASVAG